MTTASPIAPERRSWVRRHALFLTVVVVGIAVRSVVMVGYHPALIFTDSFNYLERAHDFRLTLRRPAGYSMLLWPLARFTDSLTPIVVVQHLAGVGLAAVSYAFLLRRGLPRWGAVLAVLPLLLDPLQLVLEHYVLSDVLFEVLLVAACLTLLWRHRPGVGAVVAAGVLVASAALVRGAGTFLLPVFLIAVLCLRLGWRKVTAFVLAAVLPLAGYAVAFHQEHGVYAVTVSGPHFLYARLAPIVHCDGVDLPSYERSLCPPEPVGHRHNTDWYMWGGHQSAQWHVSPPAGMTQVQVVKDFDKRVVRAEPWVYAGEVLKDVARGFAPSRTYEVPGYPASYWLFADHYWSMDTFSARTQRHAEQFGTGSNEQAAVVMTAYRHGVYLPGPLAAVMLLLALVAALGVGRARRSGDRVAIGLLASACVVPLLTGAALSGFSWRYQLPQIALLPLAGSLAIAALVRGRGPAAPEGPTPRPVLDTLAGELARLPLPVAWRRGMQRSARQGSLQLVIAVLLGVLAGCATAALAVASGWAAPALAVAVGVIVGALVGATLVVARARAGPEPGTAPHTPVGGRHSA